MFFIVLIVLIFLSYNWLETRERPSMFSSYTSLYALGSVTLSEGERTDDARPRGMKYLFHSRRRI